MKKQQETPFAFTSEIAQKVLSWRKPHTRLAVHWPTTKSAALIRSLESNGYISLSRTTWNANISYMALTAKFKTEAAQMAIFISEDHSR